ncbi:TetR/AcrR family transcriptional regulator C-terminal domain-containing protein [Stenotrophomonas indicatrix]|uniref:TetR/AcrR family transcriptional regulator C-terminal domain-containing protein n=1 Tax=Stenotrophomonas indicatrix TaxID=2045451 RepID=UPI00215A970B|nr:TetR/AcrR family transcriptional regulator C-terminal domain-containing protein [Stenotrophomonas indicatrix]MCR8713106.1 TetR/AcrR family transcriptional regulator C-terminal domain-containing protein [Stenotrophomonas indicatrix]
MIDISAQAESRLSLHQKLIVRRLTEALSCPELSHAEFSHLLESCGITEHEVRHQFRSRRDLLLALCRQRAALMLAPLRPCRNRVEFRQALLDFGYCFCEASLQLQRVAIYRLGIAESTQDREFGSEFFESGPAMVSRALSDFIEAAQTAGIVESCDSRILASHLLALLRGGRQLADMLDREEACGAVTDTAGEVARIVDLFCMGLHAEGFHGNSAA